MTTSSDSGTRRELAWLRRLRDLSHRLAAEQDVRALLPLIVDAAISFAGAERGFLVRVAEPGRSGRPRLRIEAARGFDQETLQGGLGKVSRTVVADVLDRRAPLVSTREEDHYVREVSSILARRVRAIACLPLLVRDTVLGVLYLDHRFDDSPFQEGDIPLLTAFADQAALALDTAERRAAEEAEPAPQPAPQPARSALALPDEVPRLGGLVGGSLAMRRVHAQVERAVRSLAPVLITGESGSGKELVAREVHARGPNPSEPFFSENCAALADTLLEAELFGHRRGAFTGADQDRDGLFVLAGGGTLFLDEVGDMSPTMQGKLLRVLQEGKVRPVGATQSRRVTCRVVAATHRDLKARVEAGLFREDLYYRLDVLRIHLPPLRERGDDVLVLVRHLADRGGGRLQLTSAALERFLAYPWPGNVRELENEVRRLLALGAGPLGVEHLSPELRGERGGRRDTLGARTLPEVEKAMLEEALRRSGGNKSKAARELGIPRPTLYHLLSRYGLER